VGAGGKYDAIWQLFIRLQDMGPSFGYIPEPTKNVLIMPLHNLELARAAFADLNFTVISCHNKIQDELSDLASKALIPSVVHDKPRIYSSRPLNQ
jgi:hypothetical protein